MVACLCPALALAQGPAPARPAPAADADVRERRYEGFFLHLAAGPALVRTKSTRLGNTLTMRGLGFGFDVAAGWFIRENLAVMGQVANAGATDPVVREAATTEHTDGFSIGLWGLGAGLAYYLMPAHVQLSGTVGVSSIYLSDSAGTGDYPEGRTDIGFGASFAVGKQWWVSPRWALGASARISWLRLDNTVTPGTPPAEWTGASFALALAASFG